MKSGIFKQIEKEHFEHRIWTKDLDFYADEIEIFQRQLEDLASRQIKAMLPILEDFQSSFSKQKEVLDELRHEKSNCMHFLLEWR